MGELVAFGTDLLAKALKLWAKYSAKLVQFLTKLLGQSIKITANNAAKQTKQFVKETDKKTLIGVSAAAAAILLVAGAISGCNCKKK